MYLVQIKRNTPTVRAVRHLRHQKCIQKEIINLTSLVLRWRLVARREGRRFRFRTSVCASGVCVCVCVYICAAPPPPTVAAVGTLMLNLRAGSNSLLRHKGDVQTLFGNQGFARLSRCINCFFTCLSLMWPASLLQLLFLFVFSLYSPHW
jgi:hypothetical protein